MYFNNGRFIEDITVGGKVYITDHKHTAISGDYNYTQFGESSINSIIRGDDISSIANNKSYSDSTNGSNLWSKQYIHIESSSGEPNHGSINGNGVEIVSKNGEMLVSSESHSTTIKSTNYVNLNSGTGITVNNISYGTSLPSSGVEGQIFFKLIS